MKPTEKRETLPVDDAPRDLTAGPAADLAAALHDHHERMDRMLGNVASASGDDRRAVFWWLRRFLAAHEAAERVFIRSQLPPPAADGEDTSYSLPEQEAFADLVAQLEAIDVDAAEFDELLAKLRRAVAKHARAEELDELPRIVAESKPHDIDRMRQALDHVDVLVSHRNGPLGERVRPFAQVLESATLEFEGLDAGSGV